jgi:two-component system, NtrC family, sensor histidine kinase KinB
MRLKSKLYLAFGFFFAALLLLAFLGAGAIFRLNDATQVILKDNYDSLDFAQEMLRALDAQDKPTFQANLKNQQQNITEPGEKEATDAITLGFARWNVPESTAEQNTAMGHQSGSHPV